MCLHILEARSSGRRARGAAMAAALIVLAYASVRLAPSPTLANGHAASAAQPEPGSCGLVTRKFASPEQVALAETVQVTLVVTATCAELPKPLHLVLVVDGSGAAAPVGSDLKAVLRQVVQRLNLDSHPGLRVGVVEYDDDAVARCELTEQEGRVIGCIMGADFEGPSRPDTGINEAVAMLTRGHSHYSGDPADIREAILVTMAGSPVTGCAPTVNAASGAKAKGMLLMSVCAGTDCDTQCSRQVATSPRYAYDLDDGAEIAVTLVEIYDAIPALPRAASVTITDTLPANMTYVADSASPPATFIVVDAKLVWSAIAMPPDTVTVTFSVRPSEVGRHATNVEAKANVAFVGHAELVQAFPIPEVDVIGPDTPTPTATEVPTRTPTPTPADRTWTLHLPDVRTAARGGG